MWISDSRARHNEARGPFSKIAHFFLPNLRKPIKGDTFEDDGESPFCVETPYGLSLGRGENLRKKKTIKEKRREF